MTKCKFCGRRIWWWQRSATVYYDPTFHLECWLWQEVKELRSKLEGN